MLEKGAKGKFFKQLSDDDCRKTSRGLTECSGQLQGLPTCSRLQTGNPTQRANLCLLGSWLSRAIAHTWHVWDRLPGLRTSSQGCGGRKSPRCAS